MVGKTYNRDGSRLSGMTLSDIAKRNHRPKRHAHQIELEHIPTGSRMTDNKYTLCRKLNMTHHTLINRMKAGEYRIVTVDGKPVSQDDAKELIIKNWTSVEALR